MSLPMKVMPLLLAGTIYHNDVRTSPSTPLALFRPLVFLLLYGKRLMAGFLFDA